MKGFQNDSLDLFHQGGPFASIGKHESSLGQLKTFSDWHNPSGTGFGNTMKDMIPQVVMAIRHYIDKHCAYGSEMHTLATHCLRNTTTWLLNLIEFVFDNQEVYTSSPFLTMTAWALNSKLMKQIFRDMASVRIGICHWFKIGNTLAIGLQCLWGTLQTHQVMAEYCKLQFNNHLSMSLEHIKFIATNIGQESIQRLDTKVEAAEGSLKAMTKSV
jgi:hypothetical protein